MRNFSLTAIVAALLVSAFSVAGAATFDSRTIYWSQDLFRDFRPISSMWWDVVVSEPSVACLRGHIDVRHRKRIKQAVMVAFVVTLDGEWVPGAKTGENVTWNQHYYAVQINVCFDLEPGVYDVEILGRSASSAAPHTDGLAELKPGYNQVTLEIHSME